MVLALLLAFGWATPTAKSELYQLSDTNFDLHIRADAPEDWFVMFYAPWCGHCKRLHPVWQELASFFDPSKVSIGQVNCDENDYLKDRFVIMGFPTLVFFSKGQMYEYDGPRDFESLKKFVIEGYKSASGEEVPLVPSQWKLAIKIANKSLDRFLLLFRSSPTTGLLIVVGGIFLMVISCFVSEKILKALEKRYAVPQMVPAQSTKSAAPTTSQPAPVTASKAVSAAPGATAAKNKTE